MAIHINAPSQTLGATTTTARVAYPASSLNGVCIVNTGANPVFVASGDVTVTAAINTNNCVQPNWPRVFMRNANDTHLAVITAASTSTIYFTPCSADETV